MEEVKRKVIMCLIDGTPVDLRYEPVQSISRAARFNNLEEYTAFLTGYYKPVDDTQFRPQWVEITYRKLDDNV